ncbi:MAG: hypothetical protein IRY85_01380 [Micromonosporaceae bacterium]|nr:hypothetical protein [Micromonosporaceae bacterium]
MTIGGRAEAFDEPAGMTARTFALAWGAISAKVERSGAVMVAVTSLFRAWSDPVSRTCSTTR